MGYNKEAAQAYGKKAENIQKLLEAISEEGLEDCRKADWGHVGSLGHVEEELQNILNFLTNKEV